MRILPLLLIFWMCLMMPNQLQAEELARQADAIPVGERLTYKISWLRIPVAVGELWVKEKITLNGREVFHVVGRIETNKVLSKIFPMHDEAHSWIDVQTLESVQFEKKIDEIIIHTHEKIVFDREKQIGYFESLKNGEKKQFKINVPAHDVFSVFYWLRRQPLEPGKSVKTVFVADQKNWELEVKILKKEKIKFHGKKVNTLRIEPNTKVEGVERRGLASFNFMDDPSRTPVRGFYKAIFGRVVGTLKEPDSKESEHPEKSGE